MARHKSKPESRQSSSVMKMRRDEEPLDRYAPSKSSSKQRIRRHSISILSQSASNTSEGTATTVNTSGTLSPAASLNSLPSASPKKSILKRTPAEMRHDFWSTHEHFDRGTTTSTRSTSAAPSHRRSSLGSMPIQPRSTSSQPRQRAANFHDMSRPAGETSIIDDPSMTKRRYSLDVVPSLPARTPASPISSPRRAKAIFRPPRTQGSDDDDYATNGGVERKSSSGSASRRTKRSSSRDEEDVPKRRHSRDRLLGDEDGRQKKKSSSKKDRSSRDREDGRRKRRSRKSKKRAEEEQAGSLPAQEAGPPALTSWESNRSLESTASAPSLVSFGDDSSVFSDDDDDDSSAESFGNDTLPKVEIISNSGNATLVAI